MNFSLQVERSGTRIRKQAHAYLHPVSPSVAQNSHLAKAGPSTGDSRPRPVRATRKVSRTNQPAVAQLTIVGRTILNPVIHQTELLDKRLKTRIAAEGAHLLDPQHSPCRPHHTR